MWHPIPKEIYWIIVDRLIGQIGCYESFTNPDGRAFGGGGTRGEIYTVWGWRDIDCPLLKAHTKYDIEETGGFDWEGRPATMQTNRTDEFWIWREPRKQEE